ncbi:MAG: hypothetical protein ACQER9_03185 [Nanobdellota archaeon]
MENIEQILQRDSSEERFKRNLTYKAKKNTRFMNEEKIRKIISKSINVSEPISTEQYNDQDENNDLQYEPLTQYPVELTPDHSQKLKVVVEGQNEGQEVTVLKKWTDNLMNEEERNQLFIYQGHDDYLAKISSIKEEFGDYSENALIFIAGCQTLGIPASFIKANNGDKNICCAQIYEDNIIGFDGTEVMQYTDIQVMDPEKFR